MPRQRGGCLTQGGLRALHDLAAWSARNMMHNTSTKSMSRIQSHDPCRQAHAMPFAPSSPTMRLADGELHVWCASARDVFPASPPRAAAGDSLRALEGDSVCDALVGILSYDELDQLNRFTAAEAALLYLTAHAMARLILERYDPGSLACDAPLARRRLGKPFVEKTASGRPLFFNLSHSWPLVVMAVTRVAECGVDVEMVNPRLPWREVCASALHPLERREVLADPCPGHAFYRQWTLKEAAAKARGLGLYWDFQGFRVCGRSGRVACGREECGGMSVRSFPCSCLDESLEGFWAVGCMVPPERAPRVSVHTFCAAEWCAPAGQEDGEP